MWPLCSGAAIRRAGKIKVLIITRTKDKVDLDIFKMDAHKYKVKAVSKLSRLIMVRSLPFIRVLLDTSFWPKSSMWKSLCIRSMTARP